MIQELKDLLSIQVVSVFLVTIIGALAKKYMQFHRRDFFSRPLPEQIKAVKWLRDTAAPVADPLAKAEQQFRLQSFGLHRDRDLSYKIICICSDHAQSLIPSLKTVLRYQGMYKISEGYIYPHKYHIWFVPLVMICLLVITGSEVYSGFIQSDVTQLLKSLLVFVVAFLTWGWVAVCALKISRISKTLNAYIPPAANKKSASDDFSSILNNDYP
ncbi:MAG: hypothetical protein FT726_24970 [Pantoea sp. Morm]|jgi:hypothetical protein|uniref:Uncharacterized protein n=1 Tax=Candidatus Pantoea communis TaxID=2608354 RepID=A0ABX0RXT2_9GAMM|nr:MULTISPECIES: hypothetical protein [Enterobacterales]KGT86801.1 hypothetical protein NH00_24495 [Enterobacter cancerogenus]MBK4772859.1 hypothetical protein [Pantoea sp. Morm]NIG22403.1 hypothetical protein [Pantoea communis]